MVSEEETGPLFLPINIHLAHRKILCPWSDNNGRQGGIRNGSVVNALALGELSERGVCIVLLQRRVGGYRVAEGVREDAWEVAMVNVHGTHEWDSQWIYTKYTFTNKLCLSKPQTSSEVMIDGTTLHPAMEARRMCKDLYVLGPHCLLASASPFTNVRRTRLVTNIELLLPEQTGFFIIRSLL